MNLFVDTNTFLSFYHFSSDDLDQLRKVIDLIKSGQIRLILPEQVRDEFWRNRDVKIADALKTAREQLFSKQFPQMWKDYDGYKALRGLLRAYEEAHRGLLQAITNDARNM